MIMARLAMFQQLLRFLIFEEAQKGSAVRLITYSCTLTEKACVARFRGIKSRDYGAVKRDPQFNCR
jgi:hypothetical protein